MCAQKVKISRMMSLDDKVRIIRAYCLLDTMEEKRAFMNSHKQIKNIIMNRIQILRKQTLMRTKLEAVANACSLHISMRDDFKKISLLEKVIFEWFHRFLSCHSISAITYRVMQERIEIARDILNITSFQASESWITNLRHLCSRETPRYSNMDRSLSLSIKDIIIYVLEQEGISKEKAKSMYGIYIYDEEWERKKLEISNQEGAANVVENVNEKLSEGSSLEPCEFIDVDECEFEDSQKNSDPDKGMDTDKPLKSEDGSESLVHYDTTITSFEGDMIDCQDIEDTKTNIELVKYESDVSMTSGSMEHVTLEDNKDDLQYVKYDSDIVPCHKDPTRDKLIKNNQDALEHLKPLRHFMLLQENFSGLELLSQMQAVLIKSEKT